MPENSRLTIFQRLQQALSNRNLTPPQGNSYTIQQGSNPIVDVATSPEDYQRKLLQHQQAKMLANQWVRSNYDIDNRSLAGLNEVRLMYRDCDLMDGFPEFGAALDITMEEVCNANTEGNLITISSKSSRIRAILEDLFINRLSLNVTLPMITRSMLKYGNDFMLLNVTSTNGIVGWKELPVYDIERYENGMEFPYNTSTLGKGDELKDTRFVWVGASSQALSYKNFQIAHFRLLYDSQLMPYGVSFFNKARRHFRLLSMMEDAMLLYRLDRSMEKRIFRVNVAGIDDNDIQAYVADFANKFKRREIIDPKTGQIDTRKAILNVSEDFFIPTIPGQESTPIEVLQSNQNQTIIDDLKFIQNKIFAALRVNKALLNFEENAGEGKNLSQMDIRFTKTVNRVQQAILLELNKIAIIHLTLLGFNEEVTNFKLSMHNPSQQAEMLELENIAKKITTAKDAVTDPGCGMPLMSLNYVWKNIFHWSDKEIQENLEQIRLETALAVELQKTDQIIQRTKVFDPVDNIYGIAGAQYAEGGGEKGDKGGHGGGHDGGGGMPPMGGGPMDFGEEGGPEEGMEGEMPIEQAAEEEMGGPEQGPEMGEGFNRLRKGMPINETPQVNKGELFERLTEKMLHINADAKAENTYNSVPLYDKNFLINEELDNLSKQLQLSIDFDNIDVLTKKPSKKSSKKSGK